MSEKVALIGAGVMGNAIGTRLLNTDHELRVFDLDISFWVIFYQKSIQD